MQENIAYSHKMLGNAFRNVQRMNDYSEKFLQILKGFPVYVGLQFTADKKYRAFIISKDDSVYSNANIKALFGQVEWLYELGDKMRLLEEVDGRVQKIMKKLIDMGLKTAESLDFDDVEDIEEETSGPIEVNLDDLTVEEKDMMGISTDVVKNSFEEEKNRILTSIGVKPNQIRNDTFNPSQGQSLIFLNSILQFPIEDGMSAEFFPDLYVPYIFTVNLSRTVESVKISYKGTINEKTLSMFLKKMRVLKKTKLFNERQGNYDGDAYLSELLKNPYFGIKPVILKTINNSHCRYCGSKSVYEIYYKGTILNLEVGGGESTAIAEPLMIDEYGEIEKVCCGACKAEITTINSNEKFNEKEVSKFFSDFSCPLCGDNAFKSPTRQAVKAKVDFAKIARVFDIENGMQYKTKIQAVGGLQEVRCNNPSCNHALYI